MPTITTKFLPPTNVKGSRVKAIATSGVSVTLSWDHALNVEANHRAAAAALARKMDWQGVWFQGTLPDSNNQHMVFLLNMDAEAFRV